MNSAVTYSSERTSKIISKGYEYRIERASMSEAIRRIMTIRELELQFASQILIRNVAYNLPFTQIRCVKMARGFWPCRRFVPSVFGYTTFALK